MTLLSALHSILAASPSPVPALNGRVFQITAKQRGSYPYLTMEVTSTNEILAQEGPLGTRQVRVTLNFYGQELPELDSACDQVDDALIGYSSPTPGIQRIMPLDKRHSWEDGDRVFRIIRDLDIMEDL